MLWRWVLFAVAVGVIFRVSVFVYASYHPIINESGDPVSPLLFQKGADYNFYIYSQNIYADSASQVAENIKKTLDVDTVSKKMTDSSYDVYSFVLSGPVLPLMFSLFDYSEDNTFSLSLFSLIVGLLILLLWIRFLLRFDVHPAWLALFALLPNAVWYQLNNSADHFLFLFATLFVITYYSDMAGRKRLAISAFLVILMCMTKPNALPLLAFLLLDYFRQRPEIRKSVYLRVFAAIIFGLSVFGAIFYAGYFLAVLKVTMNYSFFGIAYEEYLGGLYDALPAVIDLPLSWLSLLMAKLLYFVGLRPSWGGTPDLMVLLRAAPGLILLPGIIWLFVKGDRSMALLVALFMVPPFIGPAQERFNLSIHPLLFIHGALAYTAAAIAVRRRFAKPDAAMAERSAVARQ